MKRLMVKNYIDRAYFNKAVLMLFFSFVASACLASGSYFFVEESRRISGFEQAQLNQAKVKYRKAIVEFNLIEQYFSEYKKLQRQGFIGVESRLSWVEALDAITKKGKVIDLAYSIKPSSVYVADYVSEKEHDNIFQINSSEMVLQMKLLHERDLVDFFVEFDQWSMGVYNIKECSLIMANEKIFVAAAAVNISVRCVLNLFTIKL